LQYVALIPSALPRAGDTHRNAANMHTLSAQQAPYRGSESRELAWRECNNHARIHADPDWCGSNRRAQLPLFAVMNLPADERPDFANQTASSAWRSIRPQPKRHQDAKRSSPGFVRNFSLSGAPACAGNLCGRGCAVPLVIGRAVKMSSEDVAFLISAGFLKQWQEISGWFWRCRNGHIVPTECERLQTDTHPRKTDALHEFARPQANRSGSAFCAVGNRGRLIRLCSFHEQPVAAFSAGRQLIILPG
jgi:hypothetical protein